MQIVIHPTPNSSVTVEAEETAHPELFVHAMTVRDLLDDENLRLLSGQNSALNHIVRRAGLAMIGTEMGKVWTISHKPSEKILLYGIITRDAAEAAVQMLMASGVDFNNPTQKPYFIDAFQAGMSLVTDVYFAQLYPHNRGRLAVA